jgi:two-component system phosphate regulon response regulator OmpR
MLYLATKFLGYLPPYKSQMKKKPHILIVDDDNRILKLLKKFLLQNDFLVSTSASATGATELLKTFVFDLIILDVMMPEVTGIEFAKEIRQTNSPMPIVMLTALSDPEDKIIGLESGANDYITKPFEPRELLLRINNLINTYSKIKKQQETLHFGNIIYNLTSKILTNCGSPIKLSSTENQLFDILVESRITREDLSKKINVSNLRSVDVQIVRLRNKIEDDPKNPKFLKTIRNKGYVLYT